MVDLNEWGKNICHGKGKHTDRIETTTGYARNPQKVTVKVQRSARSLSAPGRFRLVHPAIHAAAARTARRKVPRSPPPRTRTTTDHHSRSQRRHAQRNGGTASPLHSAPVAANRRHYRRDGPAPALLPARVQRRSAASSCLLLYEPTSVRRACKQSWFSFSFTNWPMTLDRSRTDPGQQWRPPRQACPPAAANTTSA